MKTVLVLSHRFPPISGGGIMRIHSFVRHLPEHGWAPVVLTLKEDYYPPTECDYELLNVYSKDVQIIRTGSFEPSGKFAHKLRESAFGVRKNPPVFERFIKPILRNILRSISIPDEMILWLPHAMKAGLRLVKEQKIHAILTTTPTHSAGIIGALLSRLTGLPLVLDVRDDWVGNPLFFDNYPWINRTVSRWLERWVVKTAKVVIAVTQESVALYQRKYPHLDKDRIIFIPNGFDQADIELARSTAPASNSARLRITYTGVLPGRRDPEPFFMALAALKKEYREDQLPQVDFYGNIRQDYIDKARDYGLDQLVKFHGFVPKVESLRQIITSDAGLLIIPESEGSRTAIPGKVYEYIGAGKYILALCPPDSAVARLIRELGNGVTVSPVDVDGILAALKKMLELHSLGILSPSIPPSKISFYERSAQTSQLAEILRSVC